MLAKGYCCWFTCEVWRFENEDTELVLEKEEVWPELSNWDGVLIEPKDEGVKGATVVNPEF